MKINGWCCCERLEIFNYLLTKTTTKKLIHNLAPFFHSIPNFQQKGRNSNCECQPLKSRTLLLNSTATDTAVQVMTWCLNVTENFYIKTFHFSWFVMIHLGTFIHLLKSIECNIFFTLVYVENSCDLGGAACCWWKNRKI